MTTLRIDRTIYTGRPDTNHKRLPKELRVYDLLEKLHIPFQRVDHEPTNTVDSCLEVERLLDIQISKNLFLTTANQSRFLLYFMPGDKRFRSGMVSKQIGTSRLSFANEKYLEKFLDISPGSVSILGLMNDTENNVELLIDRAILELEYVGCHPCINTCSLKIKTKDLLEIFLPSIHHPYKIISLPEDES